MPHSITPRTITVAGDSKSISKLDQIVLSQVVLKEITQNTSYTVPIPIPAGSINLSGETTATVTISSMNLETKTFTVSNLSYINEPAGKTVSVVTNEVDVVLRGPAEELETIEDFNIRIVGDMTDVTASNGNYAIPAEVYVDGNGKVGAIGTEYVLPIRSPCGSAHKEDTHDTACHRGTAIGGRSGPHCRGAPIRLRPQLRELRRLRRRGTGGPRHRPRPLGCQPRGPCLGVQRR